MSLGQPCVHCAASAAQEAAAQCPQWLTCGSAPLPKSAGSDVHSDRSPADDNLRRLGYPQQASVELQYLVFRPLGTHGCSPAQVYERKSRLQQRRRSTQRYKGPFTYWDLHDFAALVVVAACLSYCGFKLGVRRGSQAPAVALGVAISRNRRLALGYRIADVGSLSSKLACTLLPHQRLALVMSTMISRKQATRRVPCISHGHRR